MAIQWSKVGQGEYYHYHLHGCCVVTMKRELELQVSGKKSGPDINFEEGGESFVFKERVTR